MNRIIQAIKAFFKTLFSGPGDTPRLPADDAARTASGLYVLAVLQREGRLIDFLREDITRFDDAQVGAAVRAIHQGCRKALDDLVSLSPIREEREGSQLQIPEGFDPHQVRLVGKVEGAPPFKGILKHHGWRVEEIRFSPPSTGRDVRVIVPAEVEIS